MSDAIRLGYVMLAAYGETQLSLARQERNMQVIKEAEESPTGIMNRSHFYHSVEVDNARFDGGFWGATRKGGIRAHNESKKKGFKGWR